MKTIHKYEFKVDDTVEITMRVGAEILSAGVQRPRHVCLWALVDDAKLMETVGFYVRGTGHPAAAAERSKFVATVFDGQFVWHVFKQ